MLDLHVKDFRHYSHGGSDQACQRCNDSAWVDQWRRCRECNQELSVEILLKHSQKTSSKSEDKQ